MLFVRAMNPRFMQVMISTLMGAMALLFLLAPRAPALGAIPPLVAAAICIASFEWQIRVMRRKSARTRATLEEIARRLLEGGTVVDGVDPNVGRSTLLRDYVRAIDYGKGATAEGRAFGARWSYVSWVSTAGRQFMEFSHVYSRVVVDAMGAQAPFRVSHRNLVKTLLAGSAVPLGDAAFDAVFRVDGDADLARAVLDDGAREMLVRLEAASQGVSMYHLLNVELLPQGLVLHWPGELTPELAQSLRDLLFHLRGRLLAHLDRRAATAVRVGAFREETIEPTYDAPAIARAAR